MNKFLSWSFAFVSAILLIAGLLSIAGSFSKGGVESFFVGVTLLASSFFTIGFSYIVEAACVYLEKNKKAENEKVQRLT